MNNPNYCDISSSWLLPHHANFDIITGYHVNETENHESCDDEFPAHPLTSLLMSKDANSSSEEACQLMIRCKTALYAFHIAGVSITSSSRTHEVYDTQGDYLQTVRGNPLKDQTHDDVDASNVDSLYSSHVILDQPCDQFSIKFLSLKGASEMQICQIRVELCRQESDISQSSGAGDRQSSMLDMLTKGGGGQIAGLLQSFLGGNPAAVDNSTQPNASVPSNASSNGMIGLMSMISRFTKISSLEPNTESDSQPSKAETSNLKAEVSQQSSVSAVGQSGQEVSGSTPDRERMYAMLQGICGQVTKKRNEEQNIKLNAKEDLDRVSGEQTDQHDDTEKMMRTHTEQIATVEKHILEQMSLMEQRLQTYIDHRLQLMEEQIASKCDKILDTLADLYTLKTLVTGPPVIQNSNTACDNSVLKMTAHNVPKETCQDSHQSADVSQLKDQKPVFLESGEIYHSEMIVSNNSDIGSDSCAQVIKHDVDSEGVCVEPIQESNSNLEYSLEIT